MINIELKDEIIDLVNKNEIKKAVLLITNKLTFLNFEDIQNLCVGLFGDGSDVGINESLILVSKQGALGYRVYGYEGNGENTVNDADYLERHSEFNVDFVSAGARMTSEERMEWDALISQREKINKENFTKDIESVINKYYGKISYNDMEDLTDKIFNK